MEKARSSTGAGPSTDTKPSTDGLGPRLAPNRWQEILHEAGHPHLARAVRGWPGSASGTERSHAIHGSTDGTPWHRTNRLGDANYSNRSPLWWRRQLAAVANHCAKDGRYAPEVHPNEPWVCVVFYTYSATRGLKGYVSSPAAVEAVVLLQNFLIPPQSGTPRRSFGVPCRYHS